jgi:hypothetical protein
MKQTAVEYLYVNLILPLGNEEIKVFKKALEIERQQMELIYEGLIQNVDTCIKQSDLPTFEQYYNETFKQQGQ